MIPLIINFHNYTKPEAVVSAIFNETKIIN